MSKIKCQKPKTMKGFTLIELLIVVAIIGILATLIITNLISVRQRARDAERKSDLRQIQSALELYRADNGSYPLSGASNSLSSCPSNSSLTNQSGTTVYMQKIPCEPLGTTFYNSGNYYYNSLGTTYTLIACLENINDPQGQTIQNNGCSTNFYFVLNNP